jgi:accessory colonization factor AcfC
MSAHKIMAQETKISLNQDIRFEKLLNEKRKINASIVDHQRYNIQIFNGDSDNAKKALGGFKNNFKNFDATIIFNTPTYKVLAGNFKTRIEAERNLVLIRKTYKTALIIKPRG